MLLGKLHYTISHLELRLIWCHAAELYHGDLGMITNDDLWLSP